MDSDSGNGRVGMVWRCGGCYAFIHRRRIANEYKRRPREGERESCVDMGIWGRNRIDGVLLVS